MPIITIDYGRKRQVLTLQTNASGPNPPLFGDGAVQLYMFPSSLSNIVLNMGL